MLWSHSIETSGSGSGSMRSSEVIMLLLNNVSELVLQWTPEIDAAFLLNSIRLVQVGYIICVYSCNCYAICVCYACYICVLAIYLFNGCQ
jgi:hypothetical protein